MTVETSRPLMRPLYFDHPNDDAVWVDAWTGARHGGGTVVQSRTPRDRVPVFVKADEWSRLRELFPIGSRGGRAASASAPGASRPPAR